MVRTRRSHRSCWICSSATTRPLDPLPDRAPVLIRRLQAARSGEESEEKPPHGESSTPFGTSPVARGGMGVGQRKDERPAVFYRRPPVDSSVSWLTRND